MYPPPLLSTPTVPPYLPPLLLQMALNPCTGEVLISLIGFEIEISVGVLSGAVSLDVVGAAPMGGITAAAVFDDPKFMGEQGNVMSACLDVVEGLGIGGSVGAASAAQTAQPALGSSVPCKHCQHPVCFADFHTTSGLKTISLASSQTVVQGTVTMSGGPEGLVEFLMSGTGTVRHGPCCPAAVRPAFPCVC